MQGDQIIRLKCGIVNCYLVKGGGGCVLVDAANPGDGPRLEKLLQAAGVPPGDITLLLLTHGHPDHVGAAAYLRQRYGIPLAMHPADARHLPGMTGRGLRGRLLLAASRRAVKAADPPTPDILLSDGMRLDGYGIDALVVALPGHTAGSVGLLLGGGRLIAGDALMNFAGPHAAHMAEDFDVLEHSLDALERRGVTTVYPGHGGPFAYARL